MSLYDKMIIGFGPGFSAGKGKLFCLKPTDGTGDIDVTRAGDDATELVSNGDFASDTIWSKGDGWSIGSGVATTTGAAGAITQTLSITENEEYYIEVTTSGAYNYGGLKVRLGSSEDVATITADGTYLFRVTAGALTTFGFYVEANSAFIGTIDDVSVKSVSFKYNATRINADGFIEGVPPNMPRSSYPIGGSANGCPSLLIEDSEVNLITYSEEFEDASWAKTDSTITANDIISPDGTKNADRLTGNTTNTTDRVSRAYTYATSKNYIISCFAKKGTTDKFRIQAYDNIGFNQASVSFDLTDGSSVISTGISATATDYGNGWWRCSVKFQTTPVLGTGSYSFYNESTTIGEYLYLWGASLELADEITSYIPTGSTTETRNVATVFEGGTSDLINTKEGVIFYELSLLHEPTTNMHLEINDGTTSNRIYIYFGSGSSIRAAGFDGGVLQFNFTGTTYTDPTTKKKIAVRYKANDFSLWVDGVEVDTDVSGTLPAAGTFDNIEIVKPANEFVGNIYSMMYFAEYLSDEELTTLTTL